MSESEVLGLFRRAVADDDSVAMRAGLDRVLGLTSGTGLSAEEEYRRPRRSTGSGTRTT